MKRFLLIAISILLYTSGFSQVLTIEIPEHHFRIDPYDHIIVVRPDNIEQYTGLTSYEEVDLALASFQFQFVSIPESLEYTGSYVVNDGSDDYHLFFTQLPLLKIQSFAIITSGSKIPSEFYYSDDSQIIVAASGVNFDTGYTQIYPKKSYSLQFWTDSGSTIETEVQVGNLQPSANYILSAMYNDPLRLRTFTAHKLWLAMHQPSYLQQEPNAHAGADGMYVELFVSGHYSGVYFFSREVDPQLLSLQPFDGTIKGELYKGKQAAAATLFTGAPTADNENRYWAGHLMKYPLDTTNWENIRGFTQFVLNSDATEFENIWDHFDYQNYLDYFIFLNLTRTADNTGKNIYMAKYDAAAPYFYVPWQLNGSFGIKWDGTDLNITNDILTNGFMDRVIASDVNDYTTDVEARWAELRTGPLSLDSLMADFTDSYDLLLANNVYEREALVYPNYPFDQESFDYTTAWLLARIAYLDVYFNYTPESVSTIAKSQFRVYPNPVKENLSIQASANLKDTPFQIVNLQGKIVKSGIYNGQSISVSDLDHGFYILKMKNIGEKIIIE